MTPQVDLVLWEVTPGLLEGLRRRVRVLSQSRSESLAVQVAEHSGRKLAIALPLSDVRLEPGSRLASVAATHHPRCLLGVGASPAAEIGSYLLADRQAAEVHAETWPQELFEAADRHGLRLQILVVTAPEKVLALLTGKLSTPRRFGRMVGRMLGGESKGLTDQRDQLLEHVAEAVLSHDID